MDKENAFANINQNDKELTETILRGFDNNEFKMYLQFIVDNKTKKIVSAEALSRWESGKRGIIPPLEYINHMKKCGFISILDFYMFELVCCQLEKWQSTEYDDIVISCNFTRITLSEPDFVDKLKSISQKYQFDKSKLAIEITEDAPEEDKSTSVANVVRCKELGFRVFLDDIGSGYSALANMCDYPVDFVKIDREMLLKTETHKGKDLFHGIVRLARSMSMKVICEGVETEEQNNFVSSSECEYIQGWYYSKPIPIEESETFINKYKAVGNIA